MFFNTTKISNKQSNDVAQITEDYPSGGALYKNAFFSVETSIMLVPQLSPIIRFFGAPQNKHYGYLMFKGLRETDTSSTGLTQVAAKTQIKSPVSYSINTFEFQTFHSIIVEVGATITSMVGIAAIAFKFYAAKVQEVMVAREIR
jgi:hypothetical protein